MKKITLIILILLAGCTSISNVKELDFGITGLEMEFYPSTPEQPDITIWDRRNDIERIYREKKNFQNKGKYPELMPLRKK
tara:strand:+ start:46 stop:285 length:240 start_codon:yes stop_codon:yes gene_type:complete